MESFNPRGNRSSGPESKIQEAIIKRLRQLGWYVKVMPGSSLQSGFPDLFACHPAYGIRLIEVKNPYAHSFTSAQRIEFPKMVTHGAPIYVLISADDSEIRKLHHGSNLHEYMSCMKIANDTILKLLQEMKKQK